MRRWGRRAARERGACRSLEGGPCACSSCSPAQPLRPQPQHTGNRYAIPEPYEKLKAFTRGQAVTQQSMKQFVQGLEGLPREAQARLLAMTPASYVGNAAAQARDIRRQLAAL